MKCCGRPDRGSSRKGSSKQVSLSKSREVAQFVRDLHDAFKPPLSSETSINRSIMKGGGISVEKFQTSVEEISSKIQSGQIDDPGLTQSLYQNCGRLRDRYASDPNKSRHKAMCRHLIEIELKLRMTLDSMPLVDLSGADLSGADLSGSNLEGVNLTGAKLDKEALSTISDDQRQYLKGIDLSGQDLSGVDLSGAILTGAELTGADLRGAELRRANLTGTDLSGVDLQDVNLSGAYTR
eukprot:COSAG01_NODE_7_length_54400_cov_1218.054935_3_plen_238_part_00